MRIFIGLACLALVASASFVNKKLSKTNCEYEDGIECANGLDGCCPSYFPYCCPDNIWCTETLDACPPINTLNILRKKALPKRLPMGKTTSASYVPECDPTEDNVCDDGKGCCGGNFPVCCPNNRCGARGDDC